MARVRSDLWQRPVANSPICLRKMAAAGSADFLVAGDKGGLLVLRQYAGCRIITVRDFLTLTRRLP